MEYDVIVVGGGIAGLTSAAYLSKKGYKVLLCEKEEKVGGLVNSFDYKGFKFDGGIRAFENSGVVIPMIKQLGLDVELLSNNVSIGLEDKLIKVTSKSSLDEYKELLGSKFPENTEDIENIIEEIKKIMKYMDILYGIDNPILLDNYEDKEYLIKTLLPWLLKYSVTNKKITKLNTPVYEHLNKFTKNQSLIDMIAQHFFQKTPTFFALSYFSLYLEYKYPRGGTGTLVEKMEQFINDNKGTIKKEIEICYMNPELNVVKDSNGNEYYYKKLIWASDLRKLYSSIELEAVKDKKVRNIISKKKEDIMDKKGGDSILTLYLTVDIDKSYFENICTEHVFYTANKTGISTLDMNKMDIKSADKNNLIDLLNKYYALTTYEISIPVMRDEKLAPKGKSGLIISTFIDYELVKNIRENGWYEEFKTISEEGITKVLNESIFKGIEAKVIDKFVSTPLTIEKITGNTDGAITGWAFTNSFIPAENRMAKITKAITTPIPNVFQAGQWSFSPSGLPISIMTGKLAADEAVKAVVI